MNESRQTVETDTLWLSKNIRALNFRKPGHLRKYCNNDNFPIYGTLKGYYYLRVQILADFENVDLAGINFSDFAITCSINSKMCDKF